VRSPEPTSDPSFEPRLPALIAIAVYVAIMLVLCWPVFQGQFLGGTRSDQFVAGYSFRLFGAEMFKATGHVPLWNPYLFGGMPFHAFFGIAVMMSSSLTTTVFTHHPASWSGTALSDEHAAGAIAWAFSEIPSVLVLLVLFMQWRRDDTRAAIQRDRAADRNNDAELNAYNEYLAGLNQGGA